jgi:exopolysaccharide biosynthesis polyprenyl glycosylphosphotransferase
MSQSQTARARRDRLAPTNAPAPSPARSRNRFPRRQQALLVLADAGLAEAFFLVAWQLAGSVGMRVGANPIGGPVPWLLAVLFPMIVASRGLYRLGSFPSWRGQAKAGLRAIAWSVGLSVGGLFLFAREIPFALRLVLLFYHAMMAAWMLAMRPLLSVLLRRRYAPLDGGPERVLILGADGPGRSLAQRITSGPVPADVVAFADLDQPRAGRFEPFHLVALEELPALAAGLQVDLVILARPDLSREAVVRVTDRLAAGGVQVRVAANALNRIVDSLPFETMGGVPLLPVGQTPMTGSAQRLKRVFDFTAALAGGLAIMPVVLLLALLVRLSSPGPVLFRQTRIGKGGRPFTFYKFRSMRVDNDDTAHREYVSSLLRHGAAAATDGAGRQVYKLVDDARVTGVGNFLRRTSLDELPQLINVLRGEMSLVGPRPCVPFEYELYRDWQKRRLDVTPGMSGLWQVTGRSFVGFEDMVLLDLFYIANWSFGTDLKLLLRTVPVVIWGRGGL